MNTSIDDVVCTYRDDSCINHPPNANMFAMHISCRTRCPKNIPPQIPTDIRWTKACPCVILNMVASLRQEYNYSSTTQCALCAIKVLSKLPPCTCHRRQHLPLSRHPLAFYVMPSYSPAPTAVPCPDGSILPAIPPPPPPFPPPPRPCSTFNSSSGTRGCPSSMIAHARRLSALLDTW